MGVRKIDGDVLTVACPCGLESDLNVADVEVYADKHVRLPRCSDCEQHALTLICFSMSIVDDEMPLALRNRQILHHTILKRAAVVQEFDALDEFVGLASDDTLVECDLHPVIKKAVDSKAQEG